MPCVLDHDGGRIAIKELPPGLKNPRFTVKVLAIDVPFQSHTKASGHADRSLNRHRLVLQNSVGAESSYAQRVRIASAEIIDEKAGYIV
jgi:hypothetical protein